MERWASILYEFLSLDPCPLSFRFSSAISIINHRTDDGGTISSTILIKTNLTAMEWPLDVVNHFQRIDFVGHVLYRLLWTLFPLEVSRRDFSFIYFCRLWYKWGWIPVTVGSVVTNLGCLRKLKTFNEFQSENLIRGGVQSSIFINPYVKP